MNKSDAKKGFILTILGGIAWGFSGTCGQYIFTKQTLSPEWMTVVRMIISGPLLFLITVKKQKENYFKLLKNKKDMLILIAFALFGVLVCQLTYLKAISHTNSGTATVLQYIGPVFILIFICLKSRKLPAKIEFLAILLAFSGTFLLATHGNISTLVISKEGLSWGLMSALGLATYTLMPKELLQKYGSTVTMSFGMIISGAIAFFLLRFWNMDFSLDAGTVFAACGVVFIGTLLSFLMYMEGVKLIGAVKASMLASIEPFSATIFSVVWLNTQFMYIDIVGFVFILSTIFLLARKKEC